MLQASASSGKTDRRERMERDMVSSFKRMWVMGDREDEVEERKGDGRC